MRTSMSDDVMCGECKHDVEDHWQDRLHGTAGCLHGCECRCAPQNVYRAALAERDAQLAEARRELRKERRQGKELARYNDRYITLTHEAEAERDALAAQLRDADGVIEKADQWMLRTGYDVWVAANKAITAWREKTRDASWRVKP